MRKHLAIVGAMLGAAAACLGPAAAGAAPGGGALYDEGSPAAPASAVTAAGSIVSRPTALLGRTLRFRGSFAGVPAGTGVVIERLDRSGAWLATATATTDADGAFLARWRTDHIGHFSVRAVREGAAADAQAASAAPRTAVTVYRGAKATWYGPGFYGHRTACGVTLTHRLLGVAHRTLPCGTQVELRYGGKTVTVPVVDRGPFAHGASWDLTSATAKALGFNVTDRLGAIALPAGTAPVPAPAPAPADPSGGTSA